MTSRILDGKAIASHLWRELSQRSERLHAGSHDAIRLAILRADDSGPVSVYAASLARAARSVGIDPVEVVPPTGAPMSDIAARLGALNRDPTIAGIVVAQPLPTNLRAAELSALIDPEKDVDGATPLNAGRLARGEPGFVPATALAVLAILNGYEIPIAGRRAVVVGRSTVVGRPVASLLVTADATVEICHRRTRNLARETRRAEILVVAAGSPHLIRPEMVNRSAVVIDCGVNTTREGIVGDVDFDGVRPVVAAISPVPGGVGPVTTMMLMAQTLDAAERLVRSRDDALDRFAMPARTPAQPD
jgi:methylenetetrahydrofolate dehydrogenase (NADP+) / methenyltetrahydrofolate cyclohydrolase